MIRNEVEGLEYMELVRLGYSTHKGVTALQGPNPGKFCLIIDLSFPHGASVNEGICVDLVSLSYITVDQVAEITQVPSWQRWTLRQRTGSSQFTPNTASFREWNGMGSFMSALWPADSTKDF